MKHVCMSQKLSLGNKLALVFMSVLFTIQTYASEARIERSRTISSEIAKMVTNSSFSTDRSNLSETVQKLQNSTMRAFLNSPTFRSDKRYPGANELSVFLAHQRKVLDDRKIELDAGKLMEIAVFIGMGLHEYKSKEDCRVSQIVVSEEFKKLEETCHNIFNAR